MSGEHDQSSWPIAVFAARLRLAGVRVGPREYEQALFVVAQQPTWARERLRGILAGLFIAGPADRTLFDAVFDLVFTENQIAPLKPDAALSPGGPPQDATEAPVSGKPDEPAGQRRKDSPPPPETASPPKKIVRVVRRALPADKLGWTLLAFVPCAVIAYLLYDTSEAAVTVAGSQTAEEAPPVAWLFAAFAGAALLGPILMVLRLITRRRVDEDGLARPKSDPTFHREPAGTPRFTFRMGAVGGALPPRLDPERLRTIVDLFVYANGEEELRELDIDRTISAVIAGAGMVTILHPRRRVLPLIVILEDANSSARLWNSIPEELAHGLNRRGFDVVRRSFSGSLHRAADRPGEAARRTALATEIESLIDDSGYAVTMVFSDCNLWQSADARLLARLGMAGRAFWFDDRDRELWDSRLDPLRNARIPIYEATGEATEEALRVAYAPVRGIGARARTAGAALGRRRHSGLAGEVHAILGGAIGWARHCALVEPVSLALAESIRATFHERVPWIALSRLAALPGTTVAAEGLRFDSRVRSLLIAELATLEAPSRKDKVISHVRKIIEQHEPAADAGDTAHASWQLSIQNVEVMRKPDEALAEIGRIRQSGLLADEPIAEFLERLVPTTAGGRPDFETHETSIRLPVRPRRSESLELLRSAQAPERRPAPHHPVWHISTPELRLGEPLMHQVLRPAMAFGQDDELILQTTTDPAQGVRIVSIDVSSGLVKETIGDVGGPLRTIVAHDKVVGFATESGRIGAFMFEAVETGESVTTSEQPAKRWRQYDVRDSVEPNEPILLCASSLRAEVLAWLPRRRVMWRLAQGDEPQTSTVPTEQEVGAIADVSENFMIAGCTSGALLSVPKRSPNGSPEISALDARFPGPITALASAFLEIRNTDGDGLTRVVAAYTERASGRHYIAALDLHLSPSRRAVERAWRPVEVLAEPHQLYVTANSTTVLVAMNDLVDVIDLDAGMSIVASEADMLLNSLGFSAEQGARVAAATLAGRRIAVTTALPPRLEVRKLERVEFATEPAESTQASPEASAEPEAAAKEAPAAS
ncbi:hypothetical protein [Reyranella soli]|uniref:Uncharacterized protein n=1 Tax=Reyranella soli TaxID=1230389 RepID=A0A512N9G8_9HYPH|nr:hypothetical protein [Reyranella soli]GEP55614.1 hypothetical protein RSO01_27800 [Reyranella soli]